MRGKMRKYKDYHLKHYNNKMKVKPGLTLKPNDNLITKTYTSHIFDNKPFTPFCDLDQTSESKNKQIGESEELKNNN